MSLSLISKFLERACLRKLGSGELPAQRFFNGRAAYRKTLVCRRGAGRDCSPGSVQLSCLMNGKFSNIAPDIAKRSRKRFNRGDAEMVAGAEAEPQHRKLTEPNGSQLYMSMRVAITIPWSFSLCVLAFSQTSYRSSTSGHARTQREEARPVHLQTEDQQPHHPAGAAAGS